jgi:hypothetical protein
MKSTVSLRKALGDPQLLGHALKDDSWRPWRTLLIAAMGEALDDDERALFKQMTQRDHEPGGRVSELIAVVGRRGGKSRATAVVAAYIAGLCDHSDVLVPGERGICLCVAPDTRVAGIVRNHVVAAFEGSPILRQLIARSTADELELKNGITVEVRPASFRKLRGPTYVAVIADELAFWFADDSYANPDVEVLAAVRPGLLTTRGLLVMASSAYAKRGVLWERYRRHYGPDGAPGILVARGTSREFNPTLPQAEIDRALEDDRARNTAEYLSEFRSDLQSFVSIEVVEACIAHGTRERPPVRGVYYRAFVDPSGGSADSFTLAVAHNEVHRSTVVLDAVREVRPPFSPELVCSEFAQLLRTYHITSVTGDRYAGQWPVEQFQKFGIRYEQAAKPKSELYVDLLPLINSARIDLLDDPRLISQLCGLERRTARGGRDSIDHPPGSHDDVANAVAGAASMCALSAGYNIEALCDGPDREDEMSTARLNRIARLGQRHPTLSDADVARISQPVALRPRHLVV